MIDWRETKTHWELYVDDKKKLTFSKVAVADTMERSKLTEQEALEYLLAIWYRSRKRVWG